MNEFELDAELRAANPITDQSVASVVPPGVGEAMLREITAAERSSRAVLFLQRLGESVPGGFGLGRAAFVGAVAAVLLIVGVAATVIGSGQQITEPAEDLVVGDTTEQAETPRPVLDASEDPDLGDPAGDGVGLGGAEANTELDANTDVADADTSDESIPAVNGAGAGAEDADGSADQASDPEEAGGDSTGSSDADTPGTEPEGNPVPESADSFDDARDLLSLHFDQGPDLGDGHATVAARVITDSLDITPWVVGGTYGSNGDSYQVDSELVMDVTWNKDGWMNAHDNWSNAVAATANRWQATLNEGGDVWVAEGGQSDLTADVVRELLVRDQRLDVSNRIHVVQHSDRNETTTSPADLSYLRSNVDYIRIEDGNWSNATADLNTVTPGWDAQARASQWGAEWSVAFDYLDPTDRLDFSDTVEVLYIVGIGTDKVGTTAEFANRFFG